MIKAVVFDFDGVITESADIKTQAFAKLFQYEAQSAVGKIVKYHLRHAGVSRFDKFAYIYKYILHRKLTEAEFKKLCKQFSRLVMNEVIDAPFVKGAQEFLNRYNKQYKFFVISATPHSEIKSIIKKRGIARYFKAVYGAPNKKADLVRRIIRDNDLACRELFYIGDALSDFEAAEANSIEFVARINKNVHLFKGKNIRFKIKDLKKLKSIINNLENI